ncbi:Ankle1 protein [Aphelenchoides avenae]|nr:Ankle1 protein [Aphelenchus avenae]
MPVEYFGPLKAAANDINMRFAGGQRAAKALQDCYQPSRVHRRLVYMLLDGGILAETAANCTSRPLVKFGQAAFYIGKGTVDRPFKHLEEARNYLLEPNSQQKQLSDCAERIADVWRDGHGVIVLPVITKLYDDDARGREAAIISLRKIGLTNRVNKAQGSFPQLGDVSSEDWSELGVMELIKVFKLYKRTEAKCCYLWDVPLTMDEIES